MDREVVTNHKKGLSDFQYGRSPEALMEEGSGERRSRVINTPVKSELFAVPGRRHILVQIND